SSGSSNGTAARDRLAMRCRASLSNSRTSPPRQCGVSQSFGTVSAFMLDFIGIQRRPNGVHKFLVGEIGDSECQGLTKRFPGHILAVSLVGRQLKRQRKCMAIAFLHA